MSYHIQITFVYELMFMSGWVGNDGGKLSKTAAKQETAVWHSVSTLMRIKAIGIVNERSGHFSRCVSGNKNGKVWWDVKKICSSKHFIFLRTSGHFPLAKTWSYAHPNQVVYTPQLNQTIGTMLSKHKTGHKVHIFWQLGWIFLILSNDGTEVRRKSCRHKHMIQQEEMNSYFYKHSLFVSFCSCLSVSSPPPYISLSLSLSLCLSLSLSLSISPSLSQFS